ncbi:hypothetical protein CN203_11540 [Sinorhizobium meliloti]|uniref:hypothetical protein n=1 Tax=Rhizobium meliloti TaxID=382 RepID=UPI000FD8BF7E|nr:hypothetical protein [Sinorhizobium meliloti]RVH78121.1 hypothetical protein CN203_11540 [Sinorhizobium meliloti]
MEVEMSAKEFLEALDAFRERHGYSYESAFRLQRLFLEDLGTVSHTEFLRKLDQNAAWRSVYLQSIMTSPEVRSWGQEGKSLQEITEELAFPARFEDTSMWALFNALQSGASAFAQMELPAYQEESTLNGSLFGQLRGMSISWARDIKPILGGKAGSAHFSKIDLQVKKREQATGGDTAVFIESQNDNGDLATIPLILQAKRFAREDAKISQRNGEIYQFHTLRDYWLPTAYIFFHNSKTRRIERPLPPLVKNVHDIAYSDTPEKTSALNDSLPLANYILRLVTTAPSSHRFVSPADAVAAMAANVSPDDLTNVIVISPSSTAELRFDEAWKSHLIENGYITEPKAEAEDDPSDDFGM